MTSKFVQRLLPFDQAPAESRVESVQWQSSSESLAAIDRLEDWLTDSRTGQMTEFAQEAVDAVRKAVAEGKNGYCHKAEDMLETLALWNKRVHGEDIPSGLTAAERRDFQADVDAVLDCLHERMLRKANGR